MYGNGIGECLAVLSLTGVMEKLCSNCFHQVKLRRNCVP